jgi:hypothetical protein
MQEYNSNVIANSCYNERLHFISDFFQQKCDNNEEITVDADIGMFNCTGNIYIHYECVKNKKHVSESYYLSPKLMCDISNVTIISICTDLLLKWRSK